ncbi:MAG: polymer-forming cytoskeletal protein [Deltaproteobacteria bacterium]|nr:polymer-forming cytoskeletal protein [Deltaproteobacteria bacterium]
MPQRTTVIGTNMRVDGNLAGDGDVVVRGHFEGAVHIGGKLTVSSGGVVRADVVAGQVVVDGCLDGSVRSGGVVHVTSRGLLSADVEGTVDVDPGGVHRGNTRPVREIPRTRVSSEVPAVPETDPLGRLPATKSSLRGPAAAFATHQESVRYYGGPGLSRMEEPLRAESGPIDFTITTGEPKAILSSDQIPVPRPPGPTPPPAWMLEGHHPDEPGVDPSDELTTGEARTSPSGPLRFTAADLVHDSEPPPVQTASGLPSVPNAETDAAGSTSVPPRPPRKPVPRGLSIDPTDLPRGRTELLIMNPPVRRTTSPGVSPVRKTFGQNTAKMQALDTEDEGES